MPGASRMGDRMKVRSPLKECSRCGGSFPQTREFFHADRRRGDGLRDDCKTCRNKVVAPVAKQYARRVSATKRDYGAVYYATTIKPKRDAVRRSKRRQPKERE